MRFILLLVLVVSSFFVAQGAEASGYHPPPPSYLFEFIIFYLTYVAVYFVYALSARVYRLFSKTAREKTIRRTYLEGGCFVLGVIPFVAYAIFSIFLSIGGKVNEALFLTGISFLMFMFVPTMLALLYFVIPKFLERKEMGGDKCRQFVHDRFFAVYSAVVFLNVFLLLLGKG